MAQEDIKVGTAGTTLPAGVVDQSSDAIVCVDGEWFWLTGEYPTLPEGPFLDQQSVLDHVRGLAAVRALTAGAGAQVPVGGAAAAVAGDGRAPTGNAPGMVAP